MGVPVHSPASCRGRTLSGEGGSKQPSGSEARTTGEQVLSPVRPPGPSSIARFSPATRSGSMPSSSLEPPPGGRSADALEGCVARELPPVTATGSAASSQHKTCQTMSMLLRRARQSASRSASVASNVSTISVTACVRG